MKKKVLISTHNLRLGGVERSFLGILQNISTSKFEVDAFLHKHDGELMEYLPKEINLLPENLECKLLLEPIQNAIKEKKASVVLTKIMAKVFSTYFNFFHKRNTEKLDSIAHFHLHKMANFFFSKISYEEYDTVIAFLHPNLLERNKIKAKKYIAFIHTDFSALNIDRAGELKMWQQYDVIAAVSEEVAKKFVQIFPNLSTKVMVLENIMSPEMIIQQAGAFDPKEELKRKDNETLFLSIGRFAYPKNFDNIPFIARELKKYGVHFKWYIIGFGGEEELIKKRIKEAHVEQEVILLGKKENPYPYIKACDIYIQPSRFEGKAITVREAQILKKPVIITNFATANSQVKHGVDGFILPLENQAFAKKLAEWLEDKEALKKVVNNESHQKEKGREEMIKLESLL